MPETLSSLNQMVSEKFSFKTSKCLRRMYGSLTFLPPSNFAVCFNMACKGLKIAQIAHVNQLFQLLNLLHIYGFCELSHMLIRKTVNNDVSKDSPI